MNTNKEPLIVLTNDDGIGSPGLLAAARALAPLGWILVVAPREQQSGSGRSMPSTNDGVIQALRKAIADDHWEVYAVGGTPAQAVQHALLELAERTPDLVVSGINFGENVGSGITISGTVGAAMEAASFGIPALAVSLETDKQYHRSHSQAVDFSTAAYFTHYFAERLLTVRRPTDVDVLKVDVPAEASPDTPWRLTRQSRQWYFRPVKPERVALDRPGPMDYQRDVDFDKLEPNSDIHVLIHERAVAVTPLSLDLTSRIAFDQFETALRDTEAK